MLFCFYCVSMVVLIELISQFIFAHYYPISVFSTAAILPLLMTNVLLILVSKNQPNGAVLKTGILISISCFWLMNQIPKNEPLSSFAFNDSVIIYSQNVHQFKNDTLVVKNIVEQIKSSKAEIVCLQEFGLYYMWPNIGAVAKDFSEQVGLAYYDFTPTRGNIFGTAIFSAYPIGGVDTIFQLLSHTNEAKDYKILVRNSELNLVNVHLQSFNFSGGGDIDALSVSQVIGHQMSQLSSVLESEFEANFMVGDFNFLPGSFPYQKFSNEDFYDAQLQLGKALHPTFMPLLNRLDYLFYNRSSSVSWLEIWPSAGSDHQAILAEIRF
jgi:endonuclease/exonuclease/phosphatase family metal-dependent hydrolase